MLLPVHAGGKVYRDAVRCMLEAGRNAYPGIATFALVAAGDADTVVVSATMIHKILKR